MVQLSIRSLLPVALMGAVACAPSVPLDEAQGRVEVWRSVHPDGETIDVDVDLESVGDDCLVVGEEATATLDGIPMEVVSRGRSDLERGCVPVSLAARDLEWSSESGTSRIIVVDLDVELVLEVADLLTRHEVTWSSSPLGANEEVSFEFTPVEVGQRFDLADVQFQFEGELADSNPIYIICEREGAACDNGSGRVDGNEVSLTLPDFCVEGSYAVDGPDIETPVQSSLADFEATAVLGVSYESVTVTVGPDAPPCTVD